MIGISFLMVVSVAMFCSSEVTACNPGWTGTPSETCWRYFQSPETYNSARASCRAIGAELVTLPTRIDVIFFKGYRTVIGKSNTRFWIGGHKYLGYWSWDGIHKGKITSTDWNTGEPNNGSGVEDCLEARVSGKWDDTPCATKLPYVCEMSST